LADNAPTNSTGAKSVNVFKSDPEKKLKRDLDTARAGRDSLIARLEAAKKLIPERRAAAQKLALEGAADTALDAAEIAIRAAEDRAATFRAALDEAEQQVAQLEKELAEIADRKQRAETAAVIEQRAVRLETAGAAFDAAVAELAEAARDISEIVLDGHPLTAFAMNVRNEVPMATRLIVQGLRDRAKATLSGHAPALLPQAPPTLVKLPPPIEQFEELFFVRRAMWTDADGKLHKIGKFTDSSVPPAQAREALKLGCAKPLSDPIRKKSRGHWPTKILDPAECAPLDFASGQRKARR
jgi:hypothetical protein